MYIFDTNSFREIFKIPQNIFPSMWEKYDLLVNNRKIISVKEVAKEIGGRDDLLAQWAKTNQSLFEAPTAQEAVFIGEIFKVRNFQYSIERQKMLKGGAFADPFLIAKAKIMDCTVVTEESFKPTSAKIPNICKHFNVKCINLEGFMELEKWKF